MKNWRWNWLWSFRQSCGVMCWRATLLEIKQYQNDDIALVAAAPARVLLLFSIFCCMGLGVVDDNVDEPFISLFLLLLNRLFDHSITSFSRAQKLQTQTSNHRPQIVSFHTSNHHHHWLLYRHKILHTLLLHLLLSLKLS